MNGHNVLYRDHYVHNPDILMRSSSVLTAECDRCSHFLCILPTSVLFRLSQKTLLVPVVFTTNLHMLSRSVSLVNHNHMQWYRFRTCSTSAPHFSFLYQGIGRCSYMSIRKPAQATTLNMTFATPSPELTRFLARNELRSRVSISLTMLFVGTTMRITPMSQSSTVH